MTLDLQGSVQVGAQLVRIEFPIATTTLTEMESVIGGYADKGIRVLALATFRGTLPTPAQVQSLAGWAKTFGPGGTFWATHAGGEAAVQSIEFGNETSYGYQYDDGGIAAPTGNAPKTTRGASRKRPKRSRRPASRRTAGAGRRLDRRLGQRDVRGRAQPRQVRGGLDDPPLRHHWKAGWKTCSTDRRPRGHDDPDRRHRVGLPTDNGRCLGEDEDGTSA